MAKKHTRPRKSAAKAPTGRTGAVRRHGDASRLDAVYQQVRAVLASARDRAWQAVNTTMVEAYREVGRIIVEEEQAGKEKADYGKRIVDGLSERLRAEFGKGYDRSNLFHMRAFFLAYPKVDALRRQLSWTHYRHLLRVGKPDARSFYEAEAVNARWSTRELARQIDSLLFERLALSRDKEGVLALARQGHEIQVPSDLVKDPFVLEFTGLRQDERFRESDLEQAPIDKLQQFPHTTATSSTIATIGPGEVLRKKRIFLDFLSYSPP
jgi:DUF1016 N-terminal domain